jgi:hypothetical protein
MRLVPLATLLFVAACATDPTTGPPVASSIEVVSGANQMGTAGYRLASPIAVAVRDAHGQPMAGVTVTFATDDEYGAAEPATAVTDAEGVATTAWRLGALGTARLRASFDPSAPAAQITATSVSTPLRWIGGTHGLLCGLAIDGRLGCWQTPRAGQANPSQAWTPLAPELRFTSLAVGDGGTSGPPPNTSAFRVCATTTAGRVWCGRVDQSLSLTAAGELSGNYPQLVRVFGNNNNSSPVNSAWCGLTTAGEAWCWGRNGSGGVGDGTQMERTSPTRVLTDARFVSIATTYYTCGLTQDGEAWCWGGNSHGQTGRPASAQPAFVPEPVQTSVRFRSITVGAWLWLGCGVAVANGIYCWGPNFDFPEQAKTATPVRAPALLSGMTQVRDVVASADILLAIDGNGAGSMWGSYLPLSDYSSTTLIPLQRTVPFHTILTPTSYFITCGLIAGSDGVGCMTYLAYAGVGYFRNWPAPFIGIPSP